MHKVVISTPERLSIILCQSSYLKLKLQGGGVTYCVTEASCAKPMISGFPFNRPHELKPWSEFNMISMCAYTFVYQDVNFHAFDVQSQK